MAAQFNVPFHFWDTATSAYSKIAIIYNRGANYRQEDVVWHAWGEICALYFPKVTSTPTGPRWAIDREAYRGYPPLGPSNTKPDLVAVKIIQIFPGQPDLLPRINSRDFLWIECKAATEDTPSGWKNALAEAATRLDTAHPTRAVFLIIAIGWKTVNLLWDPTNDLQPPQRPQIYIRPVNYGQPWLIDQRIKGIAGFSSVNAISGEFNPDRVLKLDCFSTIIENGRPILTNQNDLRTIEKFLVYIRDSALQGFNPAIF